MEITKCGVTSTIGYHSDHDRMVLWVFKGMDISFSPYPLKGALILFPLAP